jgi:nicotinamidase/pyrazinamidase
MSRELSSIHLVAGDALIAVDVQNDFLPPAGRLAVPRGDEVISVLNRLIRAFARRGFPIFATRDWHPANHCSFRAQGGLWPPHCVAGSEGAALSSSLSLPADAVIVSKATQAGEDAYSGFGGTNLDDMLRAAGARRLFVGGLATDYCVLNTVKDALQRNYPVVLVRDAVRAVDASLGDGERAVVEMSHLGALVAESVRIVS